MSNVQIPVSVNEPVHAAISDLAAQHKRSVPEQAQYILEDYLIQHGHLHQKDERDIALMRSLVDQVVDAAHAIVAESGFTSSITKDAIARCIDDPQWLSDYREFVRDDPFKTGVARKQSINANFGYRIKRTLGAESVMASVKRAANEKVLGSVIQSYTPLKR